jgi:transposase-like protein
MTNKDLEGRKTPSKSNKKQAYKKYSYALKRKIVHEIESGKRSIEDARIYYEISGKTLIYSWIKKYGYMTYNAKKDYKMKQSPQEKIKELQQRIEVLELDKDILLDIQKIYAEEYGVKVKKYLPEQLKSDYRNHIKKG